MARTFKAALLVLLLALMAGPGHAQNTALQDTTLTEGIHSSAQQSSERQMQLFRFLGERFEKMTEKAADGLRILKEQRDRIKSDVMPFYYDFNLPLEQAVLGRFGAQEVQSEINKVMRETMVGKAVVTNSAKGSDKNQASGTSLGYDAYIARKIQTVFCMPGARDTSDDCVNKKDMGINASQNFIDFFISEKTWPDATVLDVMQIARRLFAPASGRLPFGYDSDKGNFVENQSQVAKANLRMAILNDLAARRAPTSDAANSMLEMLFKIMASSTSKILTTNPDAACTPENTTVQQNDARDAVTAKSLNAYVCAYAIKPAEGPRIISLAAIDRITQYDFYLSPNFYGEINAGYQSPAALDKMEVFIRAQQLVQDYRAFRLLQMKTAAAAMKVINSNK